MNISLVFTEILKNYKRVNFNALFAHYCPLPKNYRDLKLTIMKHYKQYNNESITESADLFNELFANFIEYEEVYRLLKTVITSVFPVKFFGEQNFKLLLQSRVFSFCLTLETRKFVYMKRFETFLISDLLAEFSVKIVNFMIIQGY